MLYNFNPADGAWAVRENSMKLISAPVGSTAYTRGTHLSPISQQNVRNFSQQCLCEKSKLLFPDSLHKLLNRYRNSRTRASHGSDPPICVQCGDVADNVFDTCLDRGEPCLFDLSSDPCELNNIAKERPQVVEALMKKLEAFKVISVAPANTATEDPRASPRYHDGVWGPWLD